MTTMDARAVEITIDPGGPGVISSFNEDITSAMTAAGLPTSADGASLDIRVLYADGKQVRGASFNFGLNLTYALPISGGSILRVGLIDEFGAVVSEQSGGVSTFGNSVIYRSGSSTQYDIPHSGLFFSVLLPTGGASLTSASLNFGADFLEVIGPTGIAEPGTVALLALGFFGIGLLRRRRVIST
ncbi:MAG: PEP-CTERM sorting domain-containing protein [Pseudomonadota bacterium]